MNGDCGAMDLDDEGMTFMTRALVFNLKVYKHRFMNTIEATKRVPHQGNYGVYMEVEGPCHFFTRQLLMASNTTRTSELNYLLTKKTI